MQRCRKEAKCSSGNPEVCEYVHSVELKSAR